MTSWKIKRDYKLTENFKRILKFYLLECPIEKDSKRFNEQANLSKWDESSLERRMLASSELNKDTWKTGAPASVADYLKKINSYDNFEPGKELAFHNRACNYKKPIALIHMIRCSLAHGNFSQRTFSRKVYYVFENYHDRKLKGRAVLYEDTLLAWMRLIKKGPISKSRS